MECKSSKVISMLIAGLFIFSSMIPQSSLYAEEMSDSPDENIVLETESDTLETGSSAQARSGGQYTSTVNSTPDRWTVGDVIQYSCGAPTGTTVTWSVTTAGVISVTSTGLVTALKQGYTILKASWTQGTTQQSKSTQVYVGTIPDGTYLIGNKGTGKYMDLEGGGTADGTNIQQQLLHGYVQGQWRITLDQYGYYLIQSVCTSKYVGVENSSAAGYAKIKQYSFDRTSPGIRWLITPTASGAYKLVCKAAEGTNMVMVVPNGSSTDGTNLIQYPYTNNTAYSDEWRMAEIKALSSTTLEGQQESRWCWVATARMFAKHYYPNVSYTQADAVNELVGGVINVPGSMRQLGTAAVYYISNINGASYRDDIVLIEPGVYSESTLKGFLDGDDVVVAFRLQYEDISDPSTEMSIGHFVLIAGYVEENGDCRFLIRDPSPEDVGSTYLISYEKLYCGANSQQDEFADDWVWYATMLINTYDIEDRIPYHFENN